LSGKHRARTNSSSTRGGDEIKVHIKIENHGAAAALANKLTLEAASGGTQILSAYVRDKLEIRRWNLPARAIPLSNR
jgi:hypothetical protein